MPIQKNLQLRLIDLAKANVTAAPALVKAQDKAYAAAAESVRAGLEKKYPADDMAVLERHGCTTIDSCVSVMRLANEASKVSRFEFRQGETVPPIPQKHSCRWRGRIYDFGDRCAQLVEAWEAARDAAKADREKRLQAYKTLITSGTAREIAQTWPEAAPVIEAYNKRTLPAPLTQSVMEILKADMRERGVAA